MFIIEVRIPESDGGPLSGCVPNVEDGSCTQGYCLSVKESSEVTSVPRLCAHVE